MLQVALLAHATSAEPAVTALQLLIEREQSGWLRLSYELRGHLDAIRTSPLESLRFADRLWEHTCFELFLRTPGDARYCELNFSTSGAWAAYSFLSYREGMRPLADLKPELRVERGRDRLRVEAAVMLGELAPTFATDVLQAAPAVVIENTAGHRSFWAAHHASAKPDFHHADAFVVDVPVPQD